MKIRRSQHDKSDDDDDDGKRWKEAQGENEEIKE